MVIDDIVNNMIHNDILKELEEQNRKYRTEIQYLSGKLDEANARLQTKEKQNELLRVTLNMVSKLANGILLEQKPI